MKAPSVFMASFDGHRMELAAGCATMFDFFHFPYEVCVYEGVRTPGVDEFRPGSEMPNPMPFFGWFHNSWPDWSAAAASFW